MCGICGTAGFVDQALLEQMTGAMTHRGPDSDGFYLSEEVGLGMRRLRIIDLNTGDQPIHNEDSSIWLVFNGEIYNFQELRKNLEDKGHKFYTNSDTEAIVHLYEEYGDDCVSRLEGMFCFALWDTKQKKLFIARDRLGIKPLYYHFDSGRLRFASEMKSLVSDRSIPREVDPESVALFFSFMYVPAPRSIFKGIRKLPAASTLTFRNGDITISQYWDLSFEAKASAAPRSLNEYIEEARDVLAASVKKRLISDVPLGVFLSGGIDSSAIVAMMRQATDGEILSFSIGYGEKDASFNELDYAEIVAKRFNTKHQKFIVDPKIVELLPTVVWHLDEPFADSSSILNHLISREARKEITVALTGIGGDEVFGGYPRYIGARLSQTYEKTPGFVRKLLAGLSSLVPEGLSSRNVGGWVKRFLRGGVLSREDRYISWRQFFDKDRQDLLFAPEFSERLAGFDLREGHRKFFAQAGRADYLDRIFYTDIHAYLADDLLCLGDRMSMANSLEVRVPFCDHKLVEFCASVPYRVRYKGFRMKGLLKEALAGILPYEILHRPKKGFMVPVGRWIKEDLKDFIQDTLSEKKVSDMPFFNPSYVRNVLDSHFEGRANNAHQIWALLVFRLWYDAYCGGA